MSVIAGTRRSMKELADGTIRVQIDIDPQFKNDFMAAFSTIDMPVAIAPLVADFERKEDVAKQSAQSEIIEADKPKGGALAKLAGMWCEDVKFWDWINKLPEHACFSKSEARYVIYDICGIESRAELDNNPEAAEKFHKLIREPYSEYLRSL